MSAASTWRWLLALGLPDSTWFSRLPLLVSGLELLLTLLGEPSLTLALGRWLLAAKGWGLFWFLAVPYQVI